MRKLLIVIVCLFVVTCPVFAAEYELPAIPESAQGIMPKESTSFREDLLYIMKAAISALRPDLLEGIGICMSIIALIMATSILQSYSDSVKQVSSLSCVAAIGVLLLGPSNSLIQLGVDTVQELTEYGKMFLPVMTAALAAEGGVTTSATLYSGTILFNTILSSVISKFLIPLIYIYLVLCVANSAVGNEMIKGMQDFSKWLMTWGLKLSLYTFTGYIGVTGVISGTADAISLKATNLTVSGLVPVVGGIISEASESILISAGLIKNSLGTYGFLTILAVCVGPFFKIGIHYLLLKCTAGLCDIFGSKQTVGLVKNFSVAAGLVLAMTGSICLMLLISTVCFMKGFA